MTCCPVKRIVVLLVAAAIAASCGGVKGQFGFKKFGDDVYRRIDGTPEFASDEEVRWTFLLDAKYSERDIGIVLQKKELVWVDVYTRSQRIYETDGAVYGTIKDLAPGEYRLSLTEVKKDNRVIASKDFIVYEREEEGED